jgi:hypothetical protein
MPISITPSQLQFAYEADFVPPIVEAFSPPKWVESLSRLSETFSLKLAEITINPQSLARGHLFFSKWFQEAGSSFSVSIGGDGVSITYFKPPSRENAWEPVDKVLGTLSEAVELRCEKQSLKFQGHSALLGIEPNEFISKFNVYENEFLTSKGATFTFKGPQDNSQTFVMVSKSLFVPNGIYLVFDTTYFQESHLTKAGYDLCTDYLVRDILPRLGLELVTQ